ncbi:MAG TPA: DUF3631 domain-containing protein, partial [Candidatus Angelobacter sp.]|nr:DUF3631 domain-containing protein [Candidatus Angelobacter sp.]
DEWNKGKPIKPNELARLLEPFGIRSHNHRTGPKTVPKGYYREDLEPIWRRHLEPWKAVGCGDSPVAAKCAESTNNQVTHPASRAVAANRQNLSPAISGQQLEASSQQPAVNPVAAKLQNPVQNDPKLAASPSRPMWGADWTNTPPPTPFAGNVKKEGIGYRILKKML